MRSHRKELPYGNCYTVLCRLVFYVGIKIHWIQTNYDGEPVQKDYPCRPPSQLQCGQLQPGLFTVCVNFKHRTWITDKRSFPTQEGAYWKLFLHFFFYTIRDVCIFTFIPQGTFYIFFSLIPKGTFLII